MSLNNGLPPPPIFNNAPFWRGQIVFAGLNAIGCLISFLTPTHYHVDMFGTGAFVVAALPPLIPGNSAVAAGMQPAVQQRIQLSALAVVAWSLKLVSFLVYRIIQTPGGHDPRLAGTLNSPDPIQVMGFWTISAAWGMVCSLPHFLGVTSSLTGNPLVTKLGFAIFGTGLVVETLADYQKWMFKKKDPKGYCNVGLWSISQHPNWFGNLLVWTGITLMNVPALIEPVGTGKVLQKSTYAQQALSFAWRSRRVLAAMGSPLFLWTLFYGQATGKIAGDAMKAQQKRRGYGSDPVYTDYIDKTPLIVPNLLQLISPTSATNATPKKSN